MSATTDTPSEDPWGGKQTLTAVCVNGRFIRRGGRLVLVVAVFALETKRYDEFALEGGYPTDFKPADWVRLTRVRSGREPADRLPTAVATLCQDSCKTGTFEHWLKLYVPIIFPRPKPDDQTVSTGPFAISPVIGRVGIFWNPRNVKHSVLYNAVRSSDNERLESLIRDHGCWVLFKQSPLCELTQIEISALPSIQVDSGICVRESENEEHACVHRSDDDKFLVHVFLPDLESGEWVKVFTCPEYENNRTAVCSCRIAQPDTVVNLVKKNPLTLKINTTRMSQTAALNSRIRVHSPDWGYTSNLATNMVQYNEETEKFELCRLKHKRK